MKLFRERLSEKEQKSTGRYRKIIWVSGNQWILISEIYYYINQTRFALSLQEGSNGINR